MNINIFFLGVIGGLLVIFFLFEPLNIKQKEFTEIPVFELKDFQLKELNDKSLITVMNGVKGLRYKDRYIVYDINYTDNTKDYHANMIANKGIYKSDVIYLNGDIVFTREDGIIFLTQEGTYFKQTDTIVAPKEFIAYMGKSKLTGSFIEYNNALNTVKSKNIRVNYKLKERK